MSDLDIFYALDEIKFSLEEKNHLYHNIKDIVSGSSKEEAAVSLVQLIEDIFTSKIEELKEKMEDRKDGNFSSSGKGLFKRII